MVTGKLKIAPMTQKCTSQHQVLYLQLLRMSITIEKLNADRFHDLVSIDTQEITTLLFKVSTVWGFKVLNWLRSSL